MNLDDMENKENCQIETRNYVVLDSGVLGKHGQIVWMQITVIFVSQDFAVAGNGCVDHDARAESSSNMSSSYRMVPAETNNFQFICGFSKCQVDMSSIMHTDLSYNIKLSFCSKCFLFCFLTIFIVIKESMDCHIYMQYSVSQAVFLSVVSWAHSHIKKISYARSVLARQTLNIKKQLRKIKSYRI